MFENFPSHCDHCGAALLGGATTHDPSCPLYPLSVQGWIEGGIPDFLLEKTTMTTQEIVDAIDQVMKAMLDPAVPDPHYRLATAYTAADKLRRRLAEDLRRAADGAPPRFERSLSPEEMALVEGYLAERYGVRPPADDAPAESWRDRPPLL